MSQISIVLGAVAAAVVCAGLFLRGLQLLEIPPRRNDEKDECSSSLEQDLRDVLAILPLSEMRRVIENHARHDRQIADSVAFLEDQRRFIMRELLAIPHVNLYLFILSELGLDLARFSREFRRFWKALPRYEGKESSEFWGGGLTGMVSRLLRLAPRREVHELLRRKARESRSFRILLETLRIQQFHDLCSSVQGNKVLQRHFYWAKESGLEVIFAVELIGDLYLYLAQDLA